MTWLDKFTRWGRTATIFLLVGATPLFILPHAYDSFILPKAVWIKILVLLLALFTFLRWLYLEKGFQLRLSVINAALACFALWNSLTLVYAGSFSLAWEHVSLTLSLFVFALLLQDYLMRNKVRVVVLAWVMIAGGVATGLWVLLQDVAVKTGYGGIGIVSKLSDWRGFLSAGFGNTNHIGDHLSLCLIIAILFFIYVRRKWREATLLLLILIMGAGLFVCWSVGSNLGLVAGIAVMLYGLYRLELDRLWRKHRKRFLAILVLGIIVLAFYLTPNPLNPHKPSLWQEAFGSARWHAGGPTRLAIWLNSLEVIRHHSLFGVGAGNFTYFYVQHVSPLLITSPSLGTYAGLYTNAAHNALLQAWAELGIPGFAILLFLTAVFFQHLLQELPRSTRINYLIRLGLLSMMAAFVIEAQLNFLLQLPTSRMYFFVLLSIPPALLDKSRFGRGRLIPVEFQRAPFYLTVEMEQMRTPQIVKFGLRRPRPALKIVLTALVFALAFWITVSTIRPLVSDIAYKKARVALDMGKRQQADEYFIEALNIWEDHSDCRSAYSAFLLEQGRYEEAIAQVRKVQERLLATETFYRLGYAYYMLGDFDRAAENFMVYFERFPRGIYLYPEEYQWLQKYHEFP